MTRNSKRHARLLAAIVILMIAAVGFYGVAKLAPSRGVEVEVVNPAPVKSFPAALAGVFDEAYSKGLKAFELGDAHAAAIAFERAVTINSQSPDAFTNLGFAYVELGAWKKAEATFERALMLNPQQANAFFGLAETFEGQGELAMASSVMQAFVNLTPPEDSFRRRAEAAIWEWNAEVGRLKQHIDTEDQQLIKLKPGEPVFSLSALDLQRRPASFRNYEGKALVLNVWASWCPPCRRELPSLDRLAEELNPEEFAVVGLNVDASPDFVAEYLRELGVDFYNLWDSERRLAEGAFDVEAYPTTFLIRPDGVVKEMIVGYRDWTNDETLRKVNDLRE